jgi:glutathione reductase (NADPH)
MAKLKIECITFLNYYRILGFHSYKKLIMNTQHFDYLCLGAGSGGIASANRAAQHGAKVGLIEASDLGGTCVNLGCVPKKIMWHAAQIHDWITLYAPDYGIDASIKSVNWAKLVANRQAYIDRVHASYERVLSQRNISLIQGYARFVDARTVEVNGQQYTADHILIATGGKPILPQIPGIEHSHSSDGFFEFKQQPKRVAVVGAGYIAVELAGVLNALGTEVDLIVRHDHVLRNFDASISETLTELLEAQGIRLHRQQEVQQIEVHADHSKKVILNRGLHLDVDEIIFAIGREPNTAHLNLEAAGVATNAQGYIPVDTQQNTQVPHIYAVGDIVAEGIELTPVAVKAGRLLAMRLFANQTDAALDLTLVPTVVFSHPPVGTLGLTEAQAIATYGCDHIKVYQSHFTAMLSAVTQHREPTVLKLICQGPEEKIIGMHGIGFAMDEILQGFAVAVKMGARKKDFDAVVPIHPTSAEEWVTMT